MLNPPGLSGEPEKYQCIINLFLKEIYTKKGLPKREVLFSLDLVTRMGLEPMTPTLKVLCSTS